MENNSFTNDSNGYDTSINNNSGNSFNGYDSGENNTGGNASREYEINEYSSLNASDEGIQNKRKSDKELKEIKILFLLVLILVGIYVVYPFSKSYIENKNNTFYVTVEVDRVYQPGKYGNGVWVKEVEQPVMKCKIISINRNSYQKTHTIEGEPKINDVIWITEIHGDSYSELTQFDLTIKDGNIQGGQFVKYYDSLQGEEIYNDHITNEISTEDTSSFSVSKEESETYLQDLRGWIPDDQEVSIQSYLEQKYSETGIRMYIVFFDTNDETYIDDYSKGLINSKGGQAITYSRNANDSSWRMWWIASTNEKNEYINSHYTKVGDAYLINGTYEERLRNVIDTAYGLYE